jgi:Mrp family chromosome partitioning ATPase
MKIIPPQYQEIESLFQQVRGEQAKVITLISSYGAEGTSSVAFSLASKIRSAKKSVLVIELNQFQPIKPQTLGFDDPVGDWCFSDISCQLNIIELKKIPFLSLSGLIDIEIARESNVLSEAIIRLQQEFEYILIDMSPAMRVNKMNIPLHVVSKFTDLTLICVALGKNSESDLLEAQTKVQLAGFKSLSYVVMQQYLPPLGPQLLESIKHYLVKLPRVRLWLFKLVKKQQWLFNCP